MEGLLGVSQASDGFFSLYKIGNYAGAVFYDDIEPENEASLDILLNNVLKRPVGLLMIFNHSEAYDLNLYTLNGTRIDTICNPHPNIVVSNDLSVTNKINIRCKEVSPYNFKVILKNRMTSKKALGVRFIPVD